ncbi:MAG: PKD domain-containing protein [Armatimonadota bacterium]|jgi:hypothetical protein
MTSSRSIVVLIVVGFALLGTMQSAQAEDYVFVRKWGSYGSGNGQFKPPISVVVDAHGNVYVGDYNNHRIQKFDANGNFLTKWGSYGSGNGQLRYPRGVATDAVGNVYVAEDHRIQKFTSDGSFLTKWGSYGSGDGQFKTPRGLATDGVGNVYVADYYNHRIQAFGTNGTFLTKWGSLGSDDGQFHFPRYVATDGAGNVYVGDYYNNRIQVFSPANAAPVAVALVNGQETVTVDEESPGGTTVMLDGVDSSDPDGDELTYQWDFTTDGTVDSTDVLAFPAYEVDASYTATLTVTDPHGESDTDTVTITVVRGPPENQLANIVALIDDAVLSGDIEPELEQALLAKVDAALAALARGNPNDAKVAMNDLKALINQVEAQTNKKITQGAADAVIARANNIIADLEG